MPKCCSKSNKHHNIFLVFQISHIVIDEAHIVLSWGKSQFRPMYLQLPSLRAILQSAKILALTATATAASQEEIKKVLIMPSSIIIRESPDRPNIYLSVKTRPACTGSGRTVEDSYNVVMDPILSRLAFLGASMPRTIVYMPLQWCGYTHHRAVSRYLVDHPEEETLQSPGAERPTCP